MDDEDDGVEAQNTFKKKLNLIVAKVFAPISGNGVEIRQNRGMSTHTVQSWYYWEFVIYVEKILLMVAITYMNDYNEGTQICIIFFTLFICQFL